MSSQPEVKRAYWRLMVYANTPGLCIFGLSAKFNEVYSGVLHPRKFLEKI